MRAAGWTTCVPGPVCALLAISVLGACTSADYGRTIGDFAAATDELAVSVDAYDAALVEAVGKLNRSLALGVDGTPRSVLVHREEGSIDCTTTADRCRLVVRDGSGPRPLAPDAILSGSRALVRALASYAGDLKAVADADVASDVRASVDAMNATLVDIAHGLPDGATRAATVRFAPPVGSAVRWLGGVRLSTMKVEALRNATAAADPVVRDAADVVAGQVDSVLRVKRATLADEVERLRAAYNDRPTPEALDALMKAGRALDAALRQRPGDAVRRFGEVHGELTRALARPEPELEQVIRSIRSLEAEARGLRDVARAMAGAVRAEERL